MKTKFQNLIGFATLALAIGACTDEQDTPPINPIIGEWKAAEKSKFLTIKVDGEEITTTEFGMELLRTNEDEAEEAAEEYLQNLFLGPIDINEPEISFEALGSFTALLSGEEISGNWTLLNDQQVLKLITREYFQDDHTFNVSNLTGNSMELKSDWEMSNIGEESATYDVSMLIKLTK